MHDTPTSCAESWCRHWPAQLKQLSHEARDLDMVVRGDDFIVAGSGEAFDWLSQKLKENLELAQRARLGPGLDNEAVVLNRCVTYSDIVLTCLRAARPQTSPGGAKAKATLEELDPVGQDACHSQRDWLISSQTG